MSEKAFHDLDALITFIKSKGRCSMNPSERLFSGTANTFGPMFWMLAITIIFVYLVVVFKKWANSSESNMKDLKPISISYLLLLIPTIVLLIVVNHLKETVLLLSTLFSIASSFSFINCILILSLAMLCLVTLSFILAKLRRV